MKKILLLINFVFYSLNFSQTATLEKTLELKNINNIVIPFQNEIPLPSFEKQERATVDLKGNWKKKRFQADHNLTLANRSNDAYNAIINESPDYYSKDFNDNDWTTINIPSVENEMYEFPNVPEYYQDGVWYRYNFNVSDSLSESFVKLMFYSVNYVADVWLNDDYLGYHEGGYTPFAFNISNSISYSSENVLAIRIDNPPWGSRKDIVPFYRCDWFNYTGVIHDVYLEFSNKASVIRADVIPQNINGDITSKIVIFNSDSITKNINATIEIFETEINESNIKTELASSLISNLSESSGDKDFNFNIEPNSSHAFVNDLTISNPKLWSLANPNLYVLKVTLKENNEIIDEFYTQFGLRTIETNEKKALLNEKVIFLTGAARHEDHPVYGRSVPKDVIYDDFSMIDSSNINYIRTSHYPNHPYTYLIADRMGIAIMEEIPVWWFDNEEEWLIQNNAREIHQQMFREMVFKDFNRPSILFWSTSNECKEETNRIIYNERIVDDLRTNYNDGRLITQSSAGDNPGSGDITQNPLDVAGWTLYFGIFHGSTYYNGTLVFLSQASALNANKPIIDTEFGYWSSEDNSSYEKQLTVFDETFKALKFFSPLKEDGSLNSNGSLVGTTWWCVFDWYSHQHPNGFQSMGLISMDRQTKKPVYNLLKEKYEPYYSRGGVVITDIVDQKKPVNNNFQLNQNYPNPFNPSTKISYTIPKDSYIELSLYNILGERILILDNSDKKAGNYEYNFDSNFLSSGVYFCELKANAFENSKQYKSTIKLLLLK
ncbi:MAG: T9SS type A sorting domain-containing protein [Ignavibacteriales bacterium]|nr:T9SS type A sorting domain-containing protein [Ignavibacteriales bacterium]